MDDSLQQALALGIVVLAVIAELVRRYRKKKSEQAGLRWLRNTNIEKPIGRNALTLLQARSFIQERMRLLPPAIFLCY